MRDFSLLPPSVEVLSHSARLQLRFVPPSIATQTMALLTFVGYFAEWKNHSFTGLPTPRENLIRMRADIFPNETARAALMRSSHLWVLFIK